MKDGHRHLNVPLRRAGPVRRSRDQSKQKALDRIDGFRDVPALSLMRPGDRRRTRGPAQLLAEYHRQLAREAVLDVVTQYDADLAQRLADEAALIRRRNPIAQRLAKANSGRKKLRRWRRSVPLPLSHVRYGGQVAFAPPIRANRHELLPLSVSPRSERGYHRQHRHTIGAG